MSTDSERGVALIIALMAILLLMALGLSLALTTSTNSLVVGNYRNSYEGLYAAEASLERSLQDLLGVPQWNTILTGEVRSGFVDGPPSGVRVLPDGSPLDLLKATNVANCGKTSTCSTADMDAVTEARPWGLNNPRWTLFAYAPLNVLLPAGGFNSLLYVITWVADDASENDGNPTTDGALVTNPGSGIVSLRSAAYGPGGLYRVVEAEVARTAESEQGPARLRMLSWREVR